MRSRELWMTRQIKLSANVQAHVAAVVTRTQRPDELRSCTKCYLSGNDAVTIAHWRTGGTHSNKLRPTISREL